MLNLGRTIRYGFER